MSQLLQSQDVSSALEEDKDHLPPKPAEVAELPTVKKTPARKPSSVTSAAAVRAAAVRSAAAAAKALAGVSTAEKQASSAPLRKGGRQSTLASTGAARPGVTAGIQFTCCFLGQIYISSTAGGSAVAVEDDSQA